MIRRSHGRMRLCVVLLIMNLLFIWGNSMLPASASSALSRWLRDLLGMVSQGSAQMGEGLLRKLAHFGEFCLLGVCLSWLLGMLRSRLSQIAVMAVAGGVLTACVDEAIQSLSPGRNPSLADVGIDTAGTVLGVILLFLGYTVYKKQIIFWRKTK